MYIKETSCPYPIYADPTRALYHHLGMTSTLSLGPAPKYAQTSVFSLVVRSALLELRAGRRMLSGGDYRQVGGEFLFEGGKVVWCHRMRNTRDHAEMDVVKRQLGLDGDRDQEEKAPQRKRWSVAGFGGGSAVVGAGGGLGRRSSQRRQSWRQSWAGERSRSRNRTDPSRMGMVEEGGEKVNGEATVDASGQDVGVNGEGAVSDAMTNGTTKGTSTNGHSIS